jgi:hypothetical protein
VRGELVRYAAPGPAPLSGGRRQPYPDSAGQLVAVAETLRDVTDEKRAQAALEQLPPAMA